MWNVIESRQNPVVKLASSLADKKARDKEGLFCAEGSTLFFDFLSRSFFPETVLLSERARFLQTKVEEVLKGKACNCCLLSPAAFEKVTSEKSSEGIVAIFSKEKLERMQRLSNWEKLIALEHLQDPGNVGTVIRTAAAFGFDGVLLTGCADPFGPKAIRASMGAVAHIPVKTYPSSEEVFRDLEEHGVRTVAACLEKDALPIEKAHLSGKVCVFIGNEGKGLSRESIERAKEKAVIPISGMESLNAATAAAVFLWEMEKRKERR